MSLRTLLQIISVKRYSKLLSAAITHVCWLFVQCHRRLDFEVAHGTKLSSVSEDLLQIDDAPTIIRINSENNLDEGVKRDESDRKKLRTW